MEGERTGYKPLDLDEGYEGRHPQRGGQRGEGLQ